MPTSDSPPRISFVIPVYNERESLGELHRQLSDVLTTLPKSQGEIWFIDDGSTDDSWQVVSALSVQDSRVRGVRFQRNFGKAAALQAGFERATGDVVFTLDADLQDDPAEVPKFLAKLNEGFGVVSGWKQVRNDPPYKVFPSRIFNAMVSRVTGVKLHDHNCGFKVYRREVVKNVQLYGELHRFVPVLAAAKGFRVGEMVVNHRPRKFGYSKFGAKRYLKGFLDMLGVRFTTEYGRRPLHAFGSFAVIVGFGASVLFLLALVLSLATSWQYLGLVSLLVSLALSILAGQAFFMGLLAELLLTRTAHESSPYLIAETLRPETEAPRG
ncbi:MAG: glycosyltransferase family 2 protein [Fimbriiglobus sp.]